MAGARGASSRRLKQRHLAAIIGRDGELVQGQIVAPRNQAVARPRLMEALRDQIGDRPIAAHAPPPIGTIQRAAASIADQVEDTVGARRCDVLDLRRAPWGGQLQVPWRHPLCE